MSNHAIGYGMSSVISETFSLFDAREITFKGAVSILSTALNTVYEDDGNVYEAVDDDLVRCGSCLRDCRGVRGYIDGRQGMDGPSESQVYDLFYSRHIMFPGLCSTCAKHLLGKKSTLVRYGEKPEIYCLDPATLEDVK